MTHTELIEALGGTFAVAKLAKVKPPSVSGWKKADLIPNDKLIRLAVICEKRKIATRKALFPNDWRDIWPGLTDRAIASLAPATAGA